MESVCYLWNLTKMSGALASSVVHVSRLPKRLTSVSLGAPGNPHSNITLGVALGANLVP